MKYSQSLLHRYIGHDVDTDTFADLLTRKTCEVEDIIIRKIPESIVIGRTNEVIKHPDADSLFVCQVDCGSHGIKQIITGGENIVANAFVPVALPGTYMETLGFTIEPRKMRGMASDGMICSKQELGINEDTDQHRIRLLQTHDGKGDFADIGDADCGIALTAKYPWINNYILDVDNKSITHRPDLTGHFGLAVECKALIDKKALSYDKVSDYMQQYSDGSVQQYLQSLPAATRTVEATTSKLRSYLLLELHNIKIKPSSFHTRSQLLDIGSTPKNNWVDFSNLFMSLSGQPVHFFDADKVNGNIIIRRAAEDEHFVDLKGVEYTLCTEDIVIADQDKILALAGVIGGQSSAISESTTNVIVEIANFDPVYVRKTGTKYDLRTDAELRFEKNINPAYTLYTLVQFMDHLEYYNKDLGQYTMGGIHMYASPETQDAMNAKTVTMDRGYTSTILATETAPVLAHTILGQLGFSVHENVITVPVWRSTADITIQEDIIEEIARIHGYDTIAGEKINQSITYQPYPAYVQMRKTMEQYATDTLHMDQIETYPRVHDDVLQHFGVDTSNLYSIANPLDIQASHLRDSLVYNLSISAAKNSKFFDTFAIWDIGKVWSLEHMKGTMTQYAESFVGEQTVRGGLRYKKSLTHWQEDTLLSAKSAVQGFLGHIGLQASIQLQTTQYAIYHPSKQGIISYQDIPIGFIGSLHPVLLKKYKVAEQASMTFVQINLDALLSLQQKMEGDMAYQTLQDQIVYRDLCFVVDQNFPIGQLTQAISMVDHITNISIFDLYTGDQLTKGKKSIAMTLTISGDSMTTDDINDILQQAIQAGESVGGVLRS